MSTHPSTKYEHHRVDIPQEHSSKPARHNIRKRNKYWRTKEKRKETGRRLIWMRGAGKMKQKQSVYLNNFSSRLLFFRFRFVSFRFCLIFASFHVTGWRFHSSPNYWIRGKSNELESCDEERKGIETASEHRSMPTRATNRNWRFLNVNSRQTNTSLFKPVRSESLLSERFFLALLGGTLIFIDQSTVPRKRS